MKYILIGVTIIGFGAFYFLTDIPHLVIKELFLINNQDPVKLIVDDAILLNVVIALAFFLLLYLPSKTNREKEFFNRPFSDSLKGIAMFMIMMHHLSRCIINPSDMIIFFDLGYVGVACYLVLSGYGLTESYKQKGLKGTFIKDLFLRIFIPVLLMNTFIQVLNHLVGQEKTGIIKSIATILGIINLNWFIGFIVFWYLAYYVCYKRKFSDNMKIIILFAVSFVLLASESIHPIIRINALSFPCGVFISQYKSRIYDLYTNNKPKSFKLAVFVFCVISLILFLLFVGLLIKEPPLNQSNPYPSSIFIMQNPLSYFDLRLFLIGACIVISCIILIVKRTEVTITLILNLFFFSFFVVISTPNVPRELMQYFTANVSALLAAAFLIIVLKYITRNRSSYFFTQWGKMSLEILILHGLFLNQYVFILFKFPLHYSIILFIIFITVISYLFFKISEFIQKYF